MGFTSRYTRILLSTIIHDSDSDDDGLLLVLGEVDEESPAWQSGLRCGDAIVTVNDWKTNMMDRPEVGGVIMSIIPSIVLSTT